MTFQQAMRLRARIEMGELIPPFEYPAILDLIQDLINTKEQLDDQQMALIRTQAFLTQCQQAARSNAARWLDRPALESVVAAFRYCHEQITRRGWRQWSAGADITLDGHPYHATIILDPIR